MGLFRVRIRRVWLGMSFGFPAVIALVLLTGGAGAYELLTALLCCGAHECGHLLMMLIFRRRPEAVTLYGGGIRITPPKGRMGSFGQDAAVLLAGCAADMLLAAVGVLLGLSGYFVRMNLILGVFNLMPFRHFDGGRVLELLTDGSAGRTVRMISLVLTGGITVLLALNGGAGISLGVTFILAAASELYEDD